MAAHGEIRTAFGRHGADRDSVLCTAGGTFPWGIHPPDHLRTAVLTMLVNFVSEYLYQRYVVYRRTPDTVKKA